MAHGAHGEAGRPQRPRGTTRGETRRDFLMLATGTIGAFGVAAVAWPFIDQMNPAADVLALATTEVDISKIEVGQSITVPWRGHPVFIRRRTPEEIKAAEDVNLADLKDPQPDSDRVQKGKEQWLILVGVCTHLGCIPLGQKQGDPRGEFGGWFCPCHGSQYDTSGRIRKGPAPQNLAVPPYAFESDTVVLVGAEQEAKRPDHERRAAFQESDRAMGRPSPADLHLHASPAGLSDPEEPELLVELRLAGRDHAGRHDRHRHRAGDALHAARDHGLRQRRAHHARRQLWVADPLHPYERGVDVLHRRLHPHLPRPLLRLLQGAARAAVAAGRRHPAADDGDGVHGLRAALGADELLGRHRHHQPVLGDPARRPEHRDLAVGRLFSVDNPTLNRFFSLHYLLPFVIFAVVFLHLWALHHHKSNNPLGIDIKGPQDTIPFHPYYTVKDNFGIGVFLHRLCRAGVLRAQLLRRARQLHPGQPAADAAAIVPEWYFLPYYAILRATPDNFIGGWLTSWMGFIAVPAKLAGVILMFGSLLVLALQPWFDRSPVRSARFRPVYKWFFWIILLVAVVLGYCGAKPPEGAYVVIARVATAWYFFHFVILMPLLSVFERPDPLPHSIRRTRAEGRRVRARPGPMPSRWRRRDAPHHCSLPAPPSRLSSEPAAASAQDEQAQCIADIAAKNPLVHQEWDFNSIFGTYDQAALKRGFQVYKEVCSACHSMNLLSYRHLSGIGLSEDEIKAVAASVQVTGWPQR